MTLAFNALPKGTELYGRFTIFSRLGMGRSSAVYEALDQSTNSTVAIKVLDPFLAQDEVAVERFLREVKILRHLDHPGVIKVFDLLTDQQFKCIVMEHFPSVDGAKHFQATGRMVWRDFLTVAQTMAQIVGACHAKKVLHRDLKPQNILFGPDGSVKLVDFGISRMSSMSDLTKTGTALGTPEYMPPEAFNSSHNDPRGDIYSLGVLFYEMLTGHVPFNGHSLHEVMGQQLRGEFTPVSSLRDDVPGWIQDVITKCLQYDLNRRYQSCTELLNDLRAADKALARFDRGRESGKCVSCAGQMLPGLPFCHLCGKFGVESYEPGPTALVLQRVEEPAQVARHLLKSFPDLNEARLTTTLQRAPALLMRDISETTARAVANELYNFPLELQVTKSLPKEYRLSQAYYAVAAFGLCPLFLFPSVPMALKLVIIALTEGLVYGYFKWKTVPLINLRRLRTRRVEIAPQIVSAADKIRAVGDARVQAILGGLCIAYQQGKHNGHNTATLDQVLTEALALAAQMSVLTRYLKEQNLTAIRKKLDVADSAVKSEAMAEYKRYRLAQDQYAESVTALLGLKEQMSESGKVKVA